MDRPHQYLLLLGSRMVERSEWSNRLTGNRGSVPNLRLEAPLRQETKGGSGAFLGLGSDQERYWIKPLNNTQGARVPVTEQIVGRTGALIGAPTCSVKTIEIPEEFVGWEFRAGRKLEAGIAHASLHVGDAADVRGLDRRSDDDNARRHAYMMALYDWCWGGDPQGLVALADDSRFYSHDHGWYLPPTGPTWNAASLEACADVAHEFVAPPDGITAAFVNEIVEKLLAVESNQIREALCQIPVTWPVTDAELECVGFFLARRLAAVAARLAERFRGAK
jgi:HipA-like kinase